MLPYNRTLKENARTLRKQMTDAEIVLWSRLRGKQVLDVAFYRQKPILNHVVDFYCASAKLIIEIDGSQHFDAMYQKKDQQRDAALMALGLHVLRFSNHQVLYETNAVLEAIFVIVLQRKNLNPSL